MVEGRIQLAAWIKRSKLQKQEAGRLIGLTPSGISKILTGYRRPTLPNAVRIERATGIPVASWVPHVRGKSARRSFREQNEAVLA